ncbi:site-specific DNA-methyltransferase [Coralloluteibacterium stylophorae]|uniref:site-specific DNA-methyltransferase (adenine-specific) n=1 Tax=Coralloluteibacterium stylophorae TaxID=1776034 RepID=A0A8J7VY90_9GAMM|nr:site-specific DNA-methyltransferase [Coralloluteibacterium stylophorae]MBS7458323.1 site-specific DNA-methyltransferase [Coralloluteibacterium stylophorae]
MQIIDAASHLAQSTDLVAGNIDQLKALFPELITEGPNGTAVNVDVLKALVGDQTVTDADEKYGLNWHGKRRARQLALTPSTGTLRPCPDESVDWDTTQNLMIEGDNLEVLKLLQKSYVGKVKLIYIDPPYNTGKDFVYPDNFQDNIKNYLELTGQVEGGRKISSNTEASGRFHTDWLNMMYPRLKLARNLLRKDGVIFISIDDKEIDNLIKACSEVFGEENHIASFIWKSKSGGANDSGEVAVDHEYVVCFSRERTDNIVGLDPDAVATTTYNNEDEHGRYSLERLDKQNLQYSSSMDYDLVGPDGTIYKLEHRDQTRPNAIWRWSKDKVKNNMDSLVFKDGHVYTKNYEKPGGKPRSLLVDERFGRTRTGSTEVRDLMGGEYFSNPKPTKLLKTIAAIGSGSDAIVLDFFAGSGTSGHSVMAQNAVDGGQRSYVLVQLPEPLDPETKEQKAAAEFCDQLGKPRNIAELTKERLRRAATKIKADNPLFTGDIGFRVFKLDHSNIRAWNPNPADLEASLFDHQDHLLEGRSEADLLFELLLKLGLDLCVPIEQRTIASREVHSVGGGVLMACLAERITAKQVEPLAQGIIDWHKELAPAGDTTCVFRDSAFENDVAKTNLAAILEQHGIQNVRSL